VTRDLRMVLTMQERLQKVISQAGITSRRNAEKLIIEGRVAVNGKTVTELGTKVEAGRDRIVVDGKLIASQHYVYVLLNKPRGVVSTSSDPQGRKTVIDLVKEVPERIYSVGRLDYNTEGVLLLTNDGELTNALIHPSREIDKTYVAKVCGIPAQEKLDLLRAGIKLSDGITAPALVDIVEIDREQNIATLEITIHEGRNRQVRRMFEAIGHPINSLKRIRFAFITLTGLKRGSYRYLQPHEVEELKRYCRQEGAGSRNPK